MNSKQRAYLKGLASNLEVVVHIGKSGASPEVVNSVDEALSARELIKAAVLKNCLEDPRAVAEVIAERTHSELVQVIGRKIVFYRPDKKKPKILLPL
ncbi:MAG: ribosome assembly RNA-binding protein YhbY [Lachnospiraceae bacterium]|nr:ribosome assembly RNA-binding protein YhbY [Lachnospiraceae bacterium]